ncbi:retrotransposon protein [Cucumis melo var. makuwa]|uniref:Retrotransposon protein n=1 Tax=Cucumis melo var. makuwa TaxID=1194695 RepID=A0A5D3BCZ4_CUCMM|nr:retrotransposon protein [Cucumis melo var. makuwa]
MTTSSRASKHVWTKKEEGTLVECLVDLVSMGGWKSDNGRATGRFAETFADMGSNKPARYDGFDMSNGNEEFPSVYIQGIHMSQENNVRASRPSRAYEGRAGSSGLKRKRRSQQCQD